MPFAPRPLTTDPYFHLCSPIKPTWQEFKNAICGKEDEYVPVTKYPLCFDDNKDLLSNIGFKSSIQSIIERVNPEEPIFDPQYDTTGYDAEHFLQTAMILSKNGDKFVYEIGGRIHFVGLFFCRTPNYIKEEMDNAGFEHGNWMLDQVAFNAQGKRLNIMYGQNYPNITNLVSGLLERVSEVNSSFERCDTVLDTTSIFDNTMREFYEEYMAMLRPSVKRTAPTVTI